MTPTRQRIGLATIALILSGLSGCAILQDIDLEQVLGGGAGRLDEETVAAGLREALRIGAERTVTRTSALDGFRGNPSLRIPVPEKLDSAARTLRKLGLDRQVDEFETAMNRAAEKASREAIGVFWEAISAMTLPDAMGILRGGDTAATEFFEERTSATLRERFRPIVAEKMEQVGIYRVYGRLMDRYTQLPLVSEPVIDLDAYVTDEALTGLFSVLAQEERKIREDPAARTTELLRRVFGV